MQPFSAVAAIDPADPSPVQSMAALLMEMRQGLEGDLTLGALARAAGASPFQFHRRFTGAVGETPKRHVSRLRLERAANILAHSDDRVLDVGLAVGFNSHETFSRAFRREFGCSPRTYRKLAKTALHERMQRNRAFRGACCELSEVRFEHLPPRPLLAIRRLGAYADFAPSARERLWAELTDWADAHGVAYGAERLGLYPDDPVVTPGPMQAADVCISITAPVAGTERMRCLTRAGGLYAVVDHFGPQQTLIQAYRVLADAVRRSGRYAVREDPPVQIFLTVGEGGDPAANRSQVLLPVRKAC